MYQQFKKTTGWFVHSLKRIEKYRDSVFYDASAWSMANIYDIDYSSSNKDFAGKEVDNIDGLF